MSEFVGGRIVRTGPHRCDLPYTSDPGDTWECATCGRRWKYHAPGNPTYEGWRVTVLSWLGIRHRRHRGVS